MSPIVADASALLRLVLPEPGRGEVRRVLVEQQAAGGPILVPSSFWLEMVNTLAGTRRYSGAAVLEALATFDQIGLETRELGRAAAVLILNAVERHRLTAYDAAYLVLAEQADGRLLTADRALARAASPRAIYVDDAGAIAEPPPPYEVEPTWPTWRGAAAYLGELRRQTAEDLAAST
jgi:predicted nucleic acid-binding protein